MTVLRSPVRATRQPPLRAVLQIPLKAVFKIPLKAILQDPLKAVLANRLRAVLKVLFPLLWCVSLVGCGWQLRGTQDDYLPDELALITEYPFAPLTIAVNQAMQTRGIEDRSEAALQLYLGREELDKRTVAVTRIGSAAQYEMRLSVPFRYWRPTEQHGPWSQTIHAIRVFDFAPSDTVAKREEERTLLDEMRRELARRILHMAPPPIRHE